MYSETIAIELRGGGVLDAPPSRAMTEKLILRLGHRIPLRVDPQPA